tara:strand:+ start:879 stop:1301 length:423 start_codon:yes stop_codon:yes gene_type:complete
MTYASGTEAVSMNLKASTTVAGAGYILTNDSTNNTVDLSAATEVGVFISADESSRDSAGELETSDATVSAYPLGGVLLVATTASQTYTTGLTVYVGANGLATITAGSNKKLGLYVGSGVTTSSSAGETLIPVATAGAAIA